MTQAIISVLHKKDKDHLKCDSYWPISLLSNDYKILTRILVSRLDSAVHTIIHPDQSGFISGRKLSGNLRRLFNILYSLDGPPVSEVLISLDAHKVFDRIEYEYLFSILDRFGFGPNFCSWIRVLYTSPKACIWTNKVISDYFPLHRGTRQGCPPSPLLFDIAIEPLAIAIRKEAGLMGINRGGHAHKVSLYADDLILYLFRSQILLFPKPWILYQNSGKYQDIRLTFLKVSYSQ